MDNLKNLSIKELLALHVDIMAELRQSGVLRSENIPTGDLAESLFCQAFSWVKEPNSNKGFDAKDGSGNRYQIKGRRLRQGNRGERELSLISDFSSFDVLAGVLFDEKYGVERAALIPKDIVSKRSVKKDNGHKFFLTDDVWVERQVRDVTVKLQEIRLPDKRKL
ncbi:hypothetical protein F4X90_05540 [Candidatus Poribacteria bacterium]|nr:hypothetical protein [Candidatus Poribacteria bacterium]